MKQDTMSRSYSDIFVPGTSEYDMFKNKNVDWMSGPFVKVCYVLFLLISWGLLHISEFFSFQDSWTVANMLHGVITFILLHWIKGCPDDSTQGEYNAMTLYEQIDAGVPWTSTKKFLMLVPAVLTLIACYVADYEPFYIIINSAIFLISIIAKLPQMHRVRIFGINSTPGIDDPVKTLPGRTKKHI